MGSGEGNNQILLGRWVLFFTFSRREGDLTGMNRNSPDHRKFWREYILSLRVNGPPRLYDFLMWGLEIGISEPSSYPGESGWIPSCGGVRCFSLGGEFYVEGHTVRIKEEHLLGRVHIRNKSCGPQKGFLIFIGLRLKGVFWYRGFGGVNPRCLHVP